MDKLDIEPIRISWSQLRTASECRAKAYLQRTGHRNPTADKRNMFPGSVCDKVMRTWLNSEEQIPNLMPSMVEEILNHEEKDSTENGDGIIKWRDREDKKRVLKWCQELVSRLEPCLNALVLPFNYEPAKWFNVDLWLPYDEGNIAPVTLIGEIDILVQEIPPRFSVWDLKATADPYYWKKTLGQLVFYDLAVQSLFSVEPCMRTGLIQPMVIKSPVLYFEFTEDDYRQMWGRIHRHAIDVWRRQEDPKDDMVGCNWCDVKHSCSKMINGVKFTGGLSIKDL